MMCAPCILTSRSVKSVRVIGLDPGFGRLGFAVLERQGREWVALEYGVIETLASEPFLERLLAVYNGVDRLVKEYQPAIAGVEELFFARNVTTAIKVGQARGVALLALAQGKVRVCEFTPQEAKQAVTGYGKADKAQVAAMVKILLKLDNKKLLDDATDALAIALAAAPG